MDEATNVSPKPEQPAFQELGVRSVFRSTRRAVRASSAVRCPWSNRPPPTTGNASRLWPARCATSFQALDPDPAHLQSAEPQAHLLHVDGVPDRPVAHEQCHEPDAETVHRAQRARGQPGLARPGRAGARCRARQWRPRTAGRLLPRLASTLSSGLWLRHSLRVRPVSAGDRHGGRSSSPTTGAPADPWKIAPQRYRRGRPRRPLRDDRGNLQIVAGRPWSVIGVPYDMPVVGFGAHRQFPAALARGRPGRFDFRNSARRLVEALSAARGADHLQGAVSRTFHREGQGLRLVQEYFLVACSLRDMVRRYRRRTTTGARSRQGRHPAQRHPSRPDGAELMRVLLDEDTPGTKPGTSPSGPSPTQTTHSCPRRWKHGRGPTSSSCCRATSRSSTKSIIASWTRSPPLCRAARAETSGGMIVEGPDTRQGPHGPPGDHRLPHHQRRRSRPYRARANGAGATWR